MQFSLNRPFPRPAGGYGYNQHHLTGKLASRACAVAALANVLVYEVEELLDSDAKNPEEWLLRLARLLRPKIYGVPTMRTFMRGARRAGARFGLSLEPFLYRGPFDAQSVARFIAEGLTANHPILLLTWNHTESLFRYHCHCHRGPRLSPHRLHLGAQTGSPPLPIPVLEEPLPSPLLPRPRTHASKRLNLRGFFFS